MKYLKLVILLLIFCNLAGYALVNVGSALGSLLSYLTLLCVIVYYWFSEKQKPVLPFIILGILFFSISILVNAQYSDNYLVTLTKYFIFIIMASSVIKDVRNIEIYSILLIGSLSIIYETIFVSGIGGRYSGFYLNANFAGFACILGYAIGLTLNSKTKLKLFGQILFSIAGLVTFSRTFLLIWVLINILSVFVNYKNIYKILACAALFLVFISFGDKLDLNTKRMHAFSSILGGKVDSDLKEESRTETWSLYYDNLLNKPFWGNGYKTFSGITAGEEGNRFTIKVGVHNTFLMIMGEAGIFTLLYFLWIYSYILINGLSFFKENSSIFFVSFSLILYMLTNHNYFENYLVLFTSLWLFSETVSLKESLKLRERLFILSNREAQHSPPPKLVREYN